MADDESLSGFTDPIWTILDILPSMLSYWDCDLQCRFANRAYEKWFGVKASSLFDSSLRDLLGPELFARSEPYIQGALRGIPQEFDRIPPRIGQVDRPGLVNYLPHVVNGKVRGFVVQVTDVTRLHEMQEQLRLQAAETERVCALHEQSESKLRQAQALGQIGSWEWDVGTGMSTWSEQLYALYEVDPRLPAPVFPAEHRAFYTEESWSGLVAAVDRAVRRGEPYTMELEQVRSDGVRGWLELRGDVVRGADGAVVALHGTAQDISARRMADSMGDQAVRLAALERQLAAARDRIAELEDALVRIGATRWTPPPQES